MMTAVFDVLDRLSSHEGRISAAGTKPTPAEDAIIVDNNGAGAAATGAFTTKTSPASYWGSSHLDDNTDGNGFTWTPDLAEAGD